MPTIYQVPLLLEEQGLLKELKETLKLDDITLSPTRVSQGQEVWAKWQKTVPLGYAETVDIVLVGKYIELHDAYLSVIKALEHSAMRCGRKLNLIWVDSEHLEEKTQKEDPTSTTRLGTTFASPTVFSSLAASVTVVPRV